jgi:hypothetical protein
MWPMCRAGMAGHGPDHYPAIYGGLRKEGYRGWMAMEFLPTDDAAAELRKATAETVVPAKRILN